MVVDICNKVYENILNGIRVMERTRKVDRRTDRHTDRHTDGRTDGGHEILLTVFDGRVEMKKKILKIKITAIHFYQFV